MQTDTKSFIVRIWVESISEQENPPTWRGVVEQVGNPKRLYFQDLDRAFQFVREQAGIGGEKPVPWWHKLFQRVRHASHLSGNAQTDSETEKPPRD